MLIMLVKKATVRVTTTWVEWNWPVTQSVKWIETKYTIHNRHKPKPMRILCEIINFNGLVIQGE